MDDRNDPPEPRAGRSLPERIGKYRIVGLLGEGGMGAVYEAEQDNPRRRVALKVIKAGMASKEVLARFRLESQVLGQLQHPSIAQIYEAGADESDSAAQPWFAMEFVQGLPLLEYARAKGLGPRQCLSLIAKICDAAHYAHQRGIVHRDLKPANILVQDEETSGSTVDGDSSTASRDMDRAVGRPKILDFGVARITNADIQVTTMRTDVGQLIGTLPYMSPEQVMGIPDELDARSDVYALGVLLFELLAGHMPYALQGKPLAEALRTIKEDEPERLGTVSRALRGDVETIALKALEKEKSRRYATAGDMASDIRRFLHDEPILARPPSAMYQLRKLAHRHQGLVGGLVLAFVLLVVGTVVSLREAARATEAAELATLEAERATLEAKKSEVVAEFALSMLSAVSPETAQALDTKLMRLIADRTRDRVDVELAGQPEVEAEVRFTLGKVYLVIGEYEDARSNLERAEELYLATVGENDAKTLRVRSALASEVSNTGTHAAAEAAFREVVLAQRRELGPEDRDTMNTELGLAAMLAQEGRREESDALFADLLARSEALLPEGDELRLSIRVEYGTSLSIVGRFEEAEAVLSEVLEQRRESLGSDHPETVSVLGNLALTVSNLGRDEEAIALNEEAREAAAALYGPDHTNTLKIENNLSAALNRIGRTADALALNEKVLEARRRVLGEDNALTLYSMRNGARLMIALGRTVEGEALLEEVLELRREIHGEMHREVAQSYTDLALLYHGRGQYAETAEMFGHVAEINLELRAPDDPTVARSFYHWAATLQDSGEQQGAEELYRRALELHDERGGTDQDYVASIWNGLGKALTARDENGEADECFRKALEMRVQLFGELHVQTLYSFDDYAWFLLRTERYADGEKIARRGVACARAQIPVDERVLHNSIARIGSAQASQGRYEEAESVLIDGLDELQDPPPIELRDQYVEELVKLYEAWGNEDEAAAWRELGEEFKASDRDGG